MLIFELNDPFPRTPRISGDFRGPEGPSGRLQGQKIAIFAHFLPKIGPEGVYMYFSAKKFNPLYGPHFSEFSPVFKANSAKFLAQILDQIFLL